VADTDLNFTLFDDLLDELGFGFGEKLVLITITNGLGKSGEVTSTASTRQAPTKIKRPEIYRNGRVIQTMIFSFR